MAKPKRRHLSTISSRKKPKDLGPQIRESTQKRTTDRDLNPRSDSDDDSWIEVKKQRVIIIIPALPQPPSKPHRFKNRLTKYMQRNQGREGGSSDKKAILPADVPSSALDMLGKDGSVAQERRKEEVRSTNSNTAAAVDIGACHVYAKRKWRDGNSECNNGNKKKRLIGECSKQMLYKNISSMDILLASALDAEHSDSASWQEPPHRHDLLVRNSREDLSFDTADSGILPKDGFAAPKHPIQPFSKNLETPTPIQGPKNLVVTEPPAPKQIPGNDHVPTSEGAGAGAGNNMPLPDNEVKPLKFIQVPPILTASQTFRVSMLKKHLDKVGGFAKWLCLVGLDQFQEAFEKRIWSEAELLQLNMEDLKSMGKSAVGPRRKLIWAIHHLSRQLI